MIFNMSGGGGAALNFKVMGGTAEPSNPKENTIWVNTNNPITGWQFSSTYKSKNLLRITLTNQTYLGVNLTVNTDGSITAIGTPTNDMFLDFGKVSLKKQTGYALVLPEPTGGNAAIYVNSNNVINGSWNYGGGKTIFSLSEDGETGIALYMKSGVAHNLRLYPMVTLASETDYTHEPYGSAKEGMVWINTTSKSDGVGFNALKKNGIMICPASAKQYISGNWIKKDAFIYQNGALHNFLYTIAPNTDIAWTTNARVSVNKTSTVTQFTHTSITDSHSNLGETISYTEIDVTGYDTLYVKCLHQNNNTTGSDQIWRFRLKNLAGSVVSDAGRTVPPNTDGGTVLIEKAIDISALSGIYRIESCTMSWTAEATSMHYVSMYECRMY